MTLMFLILLIAWVFVMYGLLGIDNHNPFDS